MISIHIGPERNSAVLHLGEPVKLSGEGKVLQNAEKADQESEKHPEPNEPTPILKSAESLHGKEEEDEVGDEKQEFHPRAVGRGRAMKKPLAQNNQRKSCERREKRGENNLVFLREIEPHSPGEKEQSRASLKNSSRPILDTSVRGDGKHGQRANAEAQQPHGLRCSAGSGTKATSSTQADP